MDKHETVEDYISTSLRENEAYAEAMLACRGKWTIELTPMWASSLRSLRQRQGRLLAAGT